MSMQELRERRAALAREMKNQLADKGSATWSKEDQAAFDNKGEEIDRLDAQITAHQKAAELDREKDFKDATRKDPTRRRARPSRASSCSCASRRAS
jgi:HK97 family phage major capsid protein